MPLELTEAQRQAIAGQGGQPVEVIDPATQRTYFLIDSEQFEKVRPLLQEPAAEPRRPLIEIPPGIRKSQEAFWRALPELLKRRKLRGQWVCYHGEEQIGIARTKTELVQQCLRRGLERRDFFVGYIEESPTAPWGPWDLEQSLFEATEIERSEPPAVS